uniref:C2 NT-type domain-containing protein n=1 Tax=Noccaea caerulescens TaxID=107243 RepID=A0A1J3F4D7_NOCCA
MVVKMMKWRPWPPLVTRKYEVKVTVRRLEGWDLVRESSPEKERLTVEIRWKGPKSTLGSLRRTTVKRNFTKEAVGESDVVSWEDEEFQSLCSLTCYKDSLFYPWEIAFSVFSSGMKQGQKNKAAPVVGTAFLNLAEYARVTDQTEFELNIPLTLSASAAAASEPHPLLFVSLSLLELRTASETLETVAQTAVVPVPSPSPQQQPIETHQTEKEDVSAIKAGLRKVKIFTEFVSTRKAKKPCREEEDRFSSFESSESLDEFEEDFYKGKEDVMSVRKSFSYGPLSYANGLGSSLNSGGAAKASDEDEDWIYYSHRKSDVGGGGGGGGGCSDAEDPIAGMVYETSLLPRRSILPWRKRKLSFRSPKSKGEPLLKRDNGEEGGDDIDFDRRQLSSDDAQKSQRDEESSANQLTSFSEFGDDSFAIGSWEEKQVISRDGQMKLHTNVFLASIDQRSERAAGESACTALVAVIADWFQKNGSLMPIKSQFDSLIREGSLEWRNLCENETYMQKFPDKHFDLDTVLQAKIRSLSVIPDKSFVGFFHPEGMINEGRFEFLQGAMSFESIWDEIIVNLEESVYVVSWNDHFFVLKVEKEAYFIIDTLGERLYEGCDQAYILRFDDETVIHKNLLQTEEPQSQSESSELESEVVCRGKESCREYIKSFLAAIPIRELQEDIKKGLASTVPVHHRLQIEFHYTKMTTTTAEEIAVSK